MTATAHTHDEAALVAWQIGRAPREPWRVGATCPHGYASVVISPPVLDDGTPFPAWAWLTCPWLTQEVAHDESVSQGAAWTQRIADDPEVAASLRATDTALRHARMTEAVDGVDPCEAVGIAGQNDPLKVKCLHAHVALTLAGLDDVIGDALLKQHGSACGDVRCGRAGVARDE